MGTTRNTLFVFHQGHGDNGQLWYETSPDGSTWLPPQQVPGVGISSGPCAVRDWRDYKVYVFHQGAGDSGEFRYTVLDPDGTTWQPDKLVPHIRLSAGPSAAWYHDKIYVFYQGTSNTAGELRYSTFDGENWGDDVKVEHVRMSATPSVAVFRDKLRYYTGQSVRLTIEMGLHRVETYNDGNEELTKVRLFTFWGAYALDNAWSLTTGTVPHFSCMPRLPPKVQPVQEDEETFVYKTRGYPRIKVPVLNERWSGENPVKGLHIVLGWQKDRIMLEMPHQISIGVLGIGVVWLAVLLWMDKRAD